uniref:B9 domain-containing protein 1 n=1 Tax=Meloidogyne floridensis TaxID=298350 RepID=A0A915P084_9BILA
MNQQIFDEAGPSTSSASIRQEQQQVSQLENEDKNCFLLLITGQIETVEFLSISNVYCKYCFVYGPDWRQVGGMEEGISATAYKTERSFNNQIVLNTPIEATFSSTNPFKFTRVSTQGFVNLSLSSIFRNTKKFGYDLSKQTIIKFSEFPLDIPKINLFEKEKRSEDLQKQQQQRVAKIERIKKEKGGPTKIQTDVEIIQESVEEQDDEQK